MNDQPKFENPYVDSPNEKEQWVFVVDKQDSLFLKSIRPSTGTITGIGGYLVTKLLYELRKRNITEWSKLGEFEQFVQHCHLVPNDEYKQLLEDADSWRNFVRQGHRTLHDSTVGGTGGSSAGPDDGTRAEGLRSEPTPDAAKPSDVQSSSGTKGKKSIKGTAKAKT